jgi:hypothetical protein
MMATVLMDHKLVVQCPRHDGTDHVLIKWHEHGIEAQHGIMFDQGRGFEFRPKEAAGDYFSFSDYPELADICAPTGSIFQTAQWNSELVEAVVQVTGHWYQINVGESNWERRMIEGRKATLAHSIHERWITPQLLAWGMESGFMEFFNRPTGGVGIRITGSESTEDVWRLVQYPADEGEPAYQK